MAKSNKNIILYHFTSDRHIDFCKRDGLTQGTLVRKIYKNGKVRYTRGTQWLTKNPDYAQSWSIYSTLPYDKCANRITIQIPQQFRSNLVSWNEFAKIMPSKTVKILNSYGDPHNWFIYKGHIPPEWFIKIEHKATV
jgi:hypothetical protein